MLCLQTSGNGVPDCPLFSSPGCAGLFTSYQGGFHLHFLQCRYFKKPMFRTGDLSRQKSCSARADVTAVRISKTSMDHSGQCLHRYLHVQKLPLRVCCIQEDGVSQTSMSMEPKWKQKLAAADDHAERTRQKTLLAQEEYKQKQAAMQRLQADTSKEVLPLKDLEFLPYLSEDGLITDCSAPNAKASVYAIFDCDKVLQYVGISRQVHSSMRLHFARIPLKCYYVKIQNISKPSRSLLELVREKWFIENGTRPSGNDNGPEQNVWENPLDCKPLMTDEEKDKLEAAGAGPPKAKVLKNVARRVEAQLEKGFRGRCCKERLRFDPKLKERGLLDLKNV